MAFFTEQELKDIIISILVVTLIFAYNPLNPALTISRFPFFLILVILTFFFHEMAHKVTAMKFKCAAHYKMWPGGIILGLLFMFLNVKFVAPGAVVIYPFAFGRWGFKMVHLTVTEMGLISLSGIGVNLFFALIFRPLAGTFIFQGIDFFGSLSWINAWLAMFNLLPVPPLDGSKIFMWKMWLWAVLFILSVMLVFL